MTAKRTHTYRGRTILPCEAPEGESEGRWVVVTYYRGGRPRMDEFNPHFHTLRDAREWIEDNAKEGATV